MSENAKLIEEAREYLKRYESNHGTPDTLDGLVRRLSDALGRSEALLEKAERERDEATMALVEAAGLVLLAVLKAKEKG